MAGDRMYAEAIISENVPLAPPNHYGIWEIGRGNIFSLFP